VIRIVERIAHGDANRHNVKVHLEPVAGRPPGQGDSVQLQQVILNLMLNAFSAISGTGLDDARCLVVRTNSIDESNVLVDVQDSGTGIAAESSSRSSIPSSPASRKDWEWAFRSVAPSSNATAGRYRLRTIRWRRDVLDHPAGQPRVSLTARPANGLRVSMVARH
jgi:hypothetical protein